MKKSSLSPFRAAKRRLKKYYIVTIKKARNGDLLIPIPDDIVKAFGLKIGDVAVFEIIDKKSFIIRFVKNTMYSCVEVL